MKILFIGSGSGKTSLNRFHSSLLVRSDKHALLIDAGDGVSKALMNQNISFNEIDSILFTHYHADHFGGIASLVTQMMLVKREKPLTVYTYKSLAEPLNAFLRTSYLFPGYLGFDLVIKKFENNETCSVTGDFSFTLRKNSHVQNKHNFPEEELFNSFSIMLTQNEKHIFYTSDIGSPDDLNLFPEYEINTLICETTHISLDEISSFSLKNEIPQVIFTHIDETDEAKLLDFLNTQNDSGKHKFVIAFDGLSIT